MALYLDHLTSWVDSLESVAGQWEDRGFQVSSIKDFGDWRGFTVFFRDGFYFEFLQFKQEAGDKDWVKDWKMFLKDFKGAYDSITFASTDLEADCPKLKNYYSSPVVGTVLQTYGTDKTSGWLAFSFEDESDYLERSKHLYGINLGVLQYVSKGKKFIRSCCHGNEEKWKKHSADSYQLTVHQNGIETKNDVKIRVSPDLRNRWHAFLVRGEMKQAGNTFVDFTGRKISIVGDSSVNITKIEI